MTHLYKCLDAISLGDAREIWVLGIYLKWLVRFEYGNKKLFRYVLSGGR
jgi:hypothetical protein